jgi:rhamnosyltransferase subunit B
MRHAQGFFAAAVEACHRLKRRGLLVTRFAEQLPTRLPDLVRHVEYAPFSELLPRCAALVHHGGIGTTAQTLAAGIPHVVTPLAHDQPDNAARLERLGVGRTLRPKSVTGKSLARELSALLDSPQVAARCAELADRLRTHDGLNLAADALEAFAAQGPETNA